MPYFFFVGQLFLNPARETCPCKSPRLGYLNKLRLHADKARRTEVRHHHRRGVFLTHSPARGADPPIQWDGRTRYKTNCPSFVSPSPHLSPPTAAAPGGEPPPPPQEPVPPPPQEPVPPPQEIPTVPQTVSGLKMVRAIDSDLVFVSSKIPGEANIFEVNDIPGLRTKETVLKNLYLDELNLTVVNLHLPQRALPSLKESCYVVSGGKSLCQLGAEVASRLKLCSCYYVQFSVDSVILSQDTLVSTLYKEYQSADGFLDLSCNMVPKFPTVAPYKETRKTCKTCFFNGDLSVKVPIIAPVHVVTEQVPFPPYTIDTRRQAKKASMLRKGSSYGSGVIVYGSYGDGDLQFFGSY